MGAQSAATAPTPKPASPSPPVKKPAEPAAWPQPARHKAPKDTTDLDALQERFGNAIEAVGDMTGKPVVYVRLASAFELLSHARHTMGFDHCAFVSAADYVKEGFLEVHWQLYRYPDGPDIPGRDLVVKTSVPRDDPVVPSVVSLWMGADWHEREAYDLYGIVFDGHPDLRRIFMPDGWRGHPLRKDYDRSPQYIGMDEHGNDVVYDTPGPYRW